MAKKEPKTLEQPSLVVRFKVVEYRYTQMFYDRVSKRATTELRPYSLPYGSTVALWRDGEKIANAEVTFEGYSGHGGDLIEVFMSDSFELIETDAELMRSHYLPEEGKLYTNKIRAESLLEGDKVVLTIKKDHLVPHVREKWPFDRWLRKATQRSRRAAYEEEFKTAAWMIINRLIEEKIHPDDPVLSYSEFLETRRGATWLELLYDAVQQFGIKKPKEQTRDEIAQRLLAGLRPDERAVKLVMKDGERFKGHVVEFDPEHDRVKIRGKSSNMTLSFDFIRRVL